MSLARGKRLALVLIVIAIALLGARFGWLRHTTKRAGNAATDRSVTSPLNQPGGGMAPAEAYEIYSALYQVPMDEPLVFSEDSVTDIPQVNGSCLKPSTLQEREITEAFEAANRQSHRWENQFTIPQGFRLISRSDAAEVEICLQTHGQDSARCESYKQIRHVRFLGVPGFDHAHTRALVSVAKMCGRYCGSGGIFAVEKAGGTWRRSESTDFTRECSWMY